MEYTDKRLPNNFTVWANDFNEFVVCENGQVASIGRHNVKAADNLDDAVENYLSGKVSP